MPKPEGLGDGCRPVVAEYSLHRLLRHEGLHRTRETEAQHQCPERLPEHEEGLTQASPDVSEPDHPQPGASAFGTARGTARSGHDFTSLAMAADASATLAVAAFAALLDGIRDAMREVAVEQLDGDSLQGPRDCGDLGPARRCSSVSSSIIRGQAPSLALDPLEPGQHCGLFVLVTLHAPSIPLGGRGVERQSAQKLHASVGALGRIRTCAPGSGGRCSIP